MSQSRQESTPVKEIAKVTVWQSVLTGSVAGAIEVLIDHPLWSIKTRMQCGDTFTLKPSLLYRGIFSNAASMIPITGLQVGLNRSINNIVFKDVVELNASQKIACAFVAGMGSAMVSCPTEMVMTYQRKEKGNFYQVGRRLINQSGIQSLYSGLAATVMREGAFTAFFLAGTPILKASIQPYCANDYAASVIAGMTAGVGATLASQGVDTIKTIQQAASPSQKISLKDAAVKLYSTQGVSGFFKGSVPRGVRVMSALTIMGWVNEKMESIMKK